MMKINDGKWVIGWVSIVMGVPQARWMVCGKSHLEMDDDWGYPH